MTIIKIVNVGKLEESPLSAFVAVRSFARPTFNNASHSGYSVDLNTPCMIPQQTLDVPNVTIKAGKRYLPMITPLKIPNTRPINAATTKNTSGFVTDDSKVLHTTNIDNEAIAGKEQSTPPEIRIINSPTQNIAGTVNARIKSTMLLPAKNWPLRISTNTLNKIISNVT